MPKPMKWMQSATPDEIQRVKTIDTAILTITALNKRVATKVERLKTERTRILLRCNVRTCRARKKGRNL